jgi:hypothetical protein
LNKGFSNRIEECAEYAEVFIEAKDRYRQSIAEVLFSRRLTAPVVMSGGYGITRIE